MACTRSLTTASSFFAMSLRRLTAHSFFTGRPSDEEAVCGRREACEKKLLNDSFYRIRLDLPGLSSEDLKMWVDENKDLGFEGKIKSEAKYEYKGAIYNGTIPGCPLLCEMEKFKTELNNGVLRVTLPLTQDAKKAIQWQRDLLVEEL